MAKKIWQKIENSKVRAIWVCKTCKDEADIPPTWYEENGTPTCCNSQCEDEGRDMAYSHTIIFK